MGDWKIHGASTGGYYKCNCYKEDIKTNKRLNDGEELKEEAKYTFYFERYNNHDKAMKIALKQLEEVDEKIMTLNKTRKIPLMELQFPKEAAIALIAVRRVLKNSYAYGYYTTNPKEKVIFEDLQGSLENNCDHLHQLLEKDLSVYSKENILDDSPFFNYKSELVNYFEITKNFCEEVKSGLAEGNI
jgi:ariadne-1